MFWASCLNIVGVRFLNSLDQEPLFTNNEFYKSPAKRHLNAICSNDVLILFVHLFSRDQHAQATYLCTFHEFIVEKVWHALEKCTSLGWDLPD